MGEGFEGYGDVLVSGNAHRRGIDSGEEFQKVLTPNCEQRV